MVTLLSKVGQWLLVIFSIIIILINILLGYTSASFYGHLGDFGSGHGLVGAIIGAIIGIFACGVLLGPIATIYAIRGDLEHLVELTAKLEARSRISDTTLSGPAN